MPEQIHVVHTKEQPGFQVIKKFSCSTQLSMKNFLLINVEMPTIVGISTLMSRKIEVGLSESEKCLMFCLYFYT